MSKKTVIVGATTNPSRYAYLAAEKLTQHQHPIVLIGIKKGEVLGKPIIPLEEKRIIEDIHTITLYINPTHQGEWQDYLLGLKPKRIIFNPGTENPDFEKMASDQGIEVLEACTLVMLSIGNY